MAAKCATKNAVAWKFVGALRFDFDFGFQFFWFFGFRAACFLFLSLLYLLVFIFCRLAFSFWSRDAVRRIN